MVGSPSRTLWERPLRDGRRRRSNRPRKLSGKWTAGGWVSGKWRGLPGACAHRLSKPVRRRIFQVSGQMGSRTAQPLRRATRLDGDLFVTETPAGPLKRTPLYELHRELGARIVPFAGYEMPVQYPTGILAEH